MIAFFFTTQRGEVISGHIEFSTLDPLFPRFVHETINLLRYVNYPND